jgi:hypothetical protein
MRLFYEILAAVMLCIAVFAMIRSVKYLVMSPVSPGKDEKLFFVIAASGEAEHLQHVVSGLALLSDDVTGAVPIIIADVGLSSDAAHRAGLLCRTYDGAVLCDARELSEIFR